MADTLTKPPGDLAAEKMQKLTDGEFFWRVSTGDEVMPDFPKEKPLAALGCKNGSGCWFSRGGTKEPGSRHSHDPS